MRITFLGTGTSHGVPTIDCMLDDYQRCPHGVCRKAEHDPRYRRTRASILVEVDGTCLLIDTSQDFREQMLANRVRQIDAVLYTHGHADHIYGLPDIRSYCRKQDDAIDIYASQETLDILYHCFDYVFHPSAFVGGGIPRLRPHVLESPARVAKNGVLVTPIPVQHGALAGSQGYRIGDMAYIPDVKQIPPQSMDLLGGLELLIINCLRITPHASHLSLSESLALAQELRPRHCLFTHMTHDIDYAIEEQSLPPWIRFAYDGQIVTL
jgi:phosphoribosyl 1,2-cyclic phosphate phosphodiesterase